MQMCLPKFANARTISEMSADSRLDADSIIKMLDLKPHPEGGWYTETYRDPDGGERGHSTAIYFLLRHGEESAWHRVRDAAEVWHHYDGAALELQLSADMKDIRTLVLGKDLHENQRPQHVVPADWWQRAKSTGDWTLVGCTVAPGFDFAAFEMMT